MPDLAHRQKDAGHEGFSVHGVMSNCQDFAGATEDDFLMGDHPHDAGGVNPYAFNVSTRAPGTSSEVASGALVRTQLRHVLPT